MPRQARLDAPGTLHHIIGRAIDGTLLFCERRDRENFLSRIPPLMRTTGARILAWALMENHFHLLVLSGQHRISKFMRCLLTGYALFYNRKYRRRGHLFQDRYKSIVCEKDTYFQELIRYVHLNPLRAGRVKSLPELDDYPWTGHAVLMGNIRNDWQEKDFVLNQFSPDPKKAVRIYRRFLAEGKDHGRRDDLNGGGLLRSYGGWSRVISLRGTALRLSHDPRILGKAPFVEEILRQASPEIRKQFKTGGRGKEISQTIQLLCRQGGVNPGELKFGSQRREVSKVRAQIASRLNREHGVSMAEIARALGVTGPAVGKAIKKWETRK
jgi:putative transposase